VKRAEDIGEALGCGAHVLSLRRLRAGPFTADQMLTLDKLVTIREHWGGAALEARLLPIDALLQNHIALEVSEEQARRLRQGQKIISDFPAKVGECVRLYQAGSFLGLGEILENQVLRPKRFLAEQWLALPH